jgi:hypothetical protein
MLEFVCAALFTPSQDFGNSLRRFCVATKRLHGCHAEITAWYCDVLQKDEAQIFEDE